MKKYLKYGSIVIGSLIIIILLLPVFFKGKIQTLIKQEINDNLAAKVEFEDLSISWFKHFPRLTIGLENISIAGTEEFEGDTLLAAESFDAAINVLSLISGDETKIYGVFLKTPKIHAIINKDGKANWYIAKPGNSTQTESQPSSFNLNIQQYAISNGYIIYEDAESGMNAVLKGVNHKGKGNFNEELFTLSTTTNTSSASFSYANIPYLLEAKTNVNAEVEIQSSTAKYSFKNANLEVNDLKLIANGFFQLLNDSSYQMDISFDAPSNDFRNILSLIPAVYAKDFEKVKTTGKASFKGFVKGIYNNNQLPAFDVKLDVENGFFQYPDLPGSVKDIYLSARFSNPDGIPDHTIIDISKAHLQFGNYPVDFKLLLKNPETSKYLDFKVKGKLELADLGQYVKLEPGTKISGLIDADAFAKGNFSALAQEGGPFEAGGFFLVRQFTYAAKDLPFKVSNGNFNVQVNNKNGTADATNINITNGHIDLGSDPVDFALQLSNPVTAINFSGNVNGSLDLHKLQQMKFLPVGSELHGNLKAAMNFAGSKSDIDKGSYEKISLNGKAGLKNLFYKTNEYPSGVKLHSADVDFSRSVVTLNHLDGEYQGTKFGISGLLNNLVAYAMDKGSLKGNISVKANRVNLNEWMATDTTTSVSAGNSEPFQVPSNMDLTIQTSVNEVKYDKVVYSNVSGAMKLTDETIYLQNLRTEALDGTMNFDGSYSTKSNKKQPAINLAYSVKDINVQKAFMSFNTIKSLMPIGQFLAGKMKSEFRMTGNLGEDLFPVLTSLSGKGDLLLIEGVLGKFKPLEKIAGLLQVDALKEISLRDIKTHFEFANGKVLVNPFSIKVKDIEMQIGGSHGLDQSMDYMVAMKIPRNYLGEAGNNLVNGLTTAAIKKGIPIKPSETVNLNLRLTGFMNNPNIKTDLKESAGDMAKEMKEQAANFIQQKTDSTKNAVKDSLKQVKNEVIQDAKKDLLNHITGQKDSTGKKLSVDSTKKRTEEKIKGTLNNLLNRKKKEGQ